MENGAHGMTMEQKKLPVSIKMGLRWEIGSLMTKKGNGLEKNNIKTVQRTEYGLFMMKQETKFFNIIQKANSWRSTLRPNGQMAKLKKCHHLKMACQMEPGWGIGPMALRATPQNTKKVKKMETTFDMIRQECWSLKLNT